MYRITAKMILNAFNKPFCLQCFFVNDDENDEENDENILNYHRRD